MKARHLFISHDGTWTREELEAFARGDVIDRNGKRYRVCDACKRVIRVDRPIFGSIHICTESGNP